ncbi:GntR family transcriptional regulator [Embleya sp. NPDC020630]|uniref:GntR family transcriptional regulator n=1 Tax=Embleya sp. NPDC020630 TaxID=3363979 RepID=UPI0037A25CA4
MTLMTGEDVQPYQRIVQDVREKIRTKQLGTGDKLPSTRELSREYGVASGTVQRALSELRAARLIYSHQGRGSFVSTNALALETDQDPTARAIAELREEMAALAARLERVERHGDD